MAQVPETFKAARMVLESPSKLTQSILYRMENSQQDASPINPSNALYILKKIMENYHYLINYLNPWIESGVIVIGQRTQDFQRLEINAKLCKGTYAQHADIVINSQNQKMIELLNNVLHSMKIILYVNSFIFFLSSRNHSCCEKKWIKCFIHNVQEEKYQDNLINIVRRQEQVDLLKSQIELNV